jgi:hypothetical protein
MTTSSSGRHRDQVPSPERGAASSLDRGDPSGPHSSQQDEEAPERPLLRVVSGQPTTEELAALTAVVAALAAAKPRHRPTPVGAWASSADAMVQYLRPGPGAWRAVGRFS